MNSYDQDGIVVKKTKFQGKEMFQFDILGLAENRPSVLRGDRV